MDEISEKLIDKDKSKIAAANRNFNDAIETLNGADALRAVLAARYKQLGVPTDLECDNDATFLIGFAIGTLSRLKVDPPTIMALFHMYASCDPGNIVGGLDDSRVREFVHGVPAPQLSRLVRMAALGLFELYVGLLDRWHANNPLLSGPPESVWRDSWATACAISYALVDVYTQLVA